MAGDTNLTMLNRFNNAEEAADIAGYKYLTFLLAEEYYAFSIRHVIDIVMMQPITSVPEFPNYVKGITDLRGRIIPIIDVRIRFHLKEVEYTERTCIIVVDIGGVEVGFLVDTVDAVIDIFDNEISPPPAVGAGGPGGRRYLAGVAKNKEKVILLLDADKMLNREELENIAAVAS